MVVFVQGVIWTDKEMKENDRKEKAFQVKLRKEKLKSENRKRKNELREVKQENRFLSERRKKFTTTKILMYYILINCTAIEIYSMVVMYLFQDLSALYSLIGAVIGESVSYAVYCAKSFNDTKEECKSRLERDKFEAGLLGENDSEDDLPPDDIPFDNDHSGDIPPGMEEVEEPNSYV